VTEGPALSVRDFFVGAVFEGVLPYHCKSWPLPQRASISSIGIQSFVELSNNMPMGVMPPYKADPKILKKLAIGPDLAEDKILERLWLGGF